MARRERKPEELRPASERVARAMERLFGSLSDCMAVQRAHYAGENPSPWTRQALLGAWVIHLRHAMHFLRPLHAQPDDIVAEDYFPGEGWPELLGESGGEDWTAILPESALAAWIESEILSLGYGQSHTAEDANGWPLASMTVHLRRDLQMFLDNVSVELVSQDFTTRLQQALDSVR